mmetsp:Transcript_18172/g.37870  ORF Transcript_18172/g.37870 Transcript_18172/m.37870 type:complete len:543 (-) Transcript_18172:31-1659(-)
MVEMAFCGSWVGRFGGCRGNVQICDRRDGDWVNTVVSKRGGFLGNRVGVGRSCGHARTREWTMLMDGLVERLNETVRKVQGTDKITERNVEKTIKEVKRALLEADVNLKVVNSFIRQVKERAIGAEVIQGVQPGQQFVKILYEELVRIMGEKESTLAKPASSSRPCVILLAGLQGAGKTTAAAKLALYCREKEARKVMLAACDIYRPAAIDQLKTLGASINVEVFERGTENSPVSIAADAIRHATEKGYDTVIVDTAGRQVIDERLMQELQQVKRVSQADETLLVVDAMTGQEAANLTRAFNEQIGITGAILTKLDGDTRGGSALSVREVSGKPIKFVGVGEKVEKLEVFYPDRMASRILGMGDVLSFVEKAQEKMDQKEAERLTQKMMDATFNFEDFLRQSQMMSSMGSMGGLLKMMPGMGKIDPSKLSEAENRLKIASSLIQSMTLRERRYPELLITDRTASSRLQRIARGSGRTKRDADAFIGDFQRMRTMMQRMSKGMQAGAAGEGPLPNAMNRAARRKTEKKKIDRGGASSKGFGKR